jgi:geranylgeranyl diphosphate synthase type II
MTPSPTLHQWRSDIQQAMLSMLPERHLNDPELEAFYQLLRDYPKRSGKGLRGLFVLLSTAAHGGASERGLIPAAALELFQNWVLVHDDIEDDSEVRRGAPALHRRVGVPIALNVGDAMHVYMWEALMALQAAPNFRADAVRSEFARLIHRTAEGQHLDLSWVAQGRFAIEEADYLRMVTLKTSWYTVIGPLNLGAYVAGRTPDPRFETFGARLGAAFQIRDDVLNLDPDKATGKEFAGDLYEGKRTLILAHLLAHATQAEVEATEATLRRPRAEKQREAVAEILVLIERYGSLRYAQSVAEAEAAAALTGLQEALAELPGREAVATLLGAFAELTQRQN